MPTLDYITAGESHGPALVVIVSGMPAGLSVDVEAINRELRRRQGGYGRGGRQRIEEDSVEFLSGMSKGGRGGETLGGPIAMMIRNRDSRLDDAGRPPPPPVHRPRPGHADLAGSLKWLTVDCRGTLERASARETAARTAAGALARQLLAVFGVEVFGFVRAVLDAQTEVAPDPGNWRELLKARDASETYCPDTAVTARQIEIIRQAKRDKDTVGGLCEAHVFGVPPGIGTCVDWREKLDARLAYAVMGIQAFKAVQIGLGVECARRPGSQVHDPIRFDGSKRDEHTLGFVRDSNNAGGTEGGMSNGQPVVVRGTMKPISTLLRGLPSVDLNTKGAEQSQYERSDVCAVSAASVVMENVVAFEIARAMRDKFGGDSMTEMRRNWRGYMDHARVLPLEPPEMTIA